MAPYLFPYPTAAPITFSNILLDRTSSYTTQLSEATVARTRLQVALKVAADGDPSGSALGVLEAVQVYHPFLKGVIACLDTDDLLFKGDSPTFPWKSSLTQYPVSAPLLPLPSIQAEQLFVCMAYVAALSNYAHSILGALPAFETKAGTGVPNITAEDAKRTTAALTRAVDLLSQASGVASWAADSVAPLLEDSRRATGGRLGKVKWPVETAPEAFRGLSMMLLADAHVTAIRKLLLPVLGHQLFAPPGPPLPSNHPSPSLLGKLYLHVAELYTSAAALFRVHDHVAGPSSGRKLFGRDKKIIGGPGAPDTDAPDCEVIPELRRYLKKEAALASALAYKWLGIDAGENGKGARVGEAVTWVREAHSRLGDMEDGKVADKMKGLGLGRGVERRKEARKARQGRVEREVADTAAWVSAYTKMNDTVSFQPVPPANTLVLPPGRPIFAAKSFSPPEPKFVPLLSPEEGEEHSSGEGSRSPDEAAYAGRGNYF